jgi:hypothetical protein
MNIFDKNLTQPILTKPYLKYIIEHSNISKKIVCLLIDDATYLLKGTMPPNNLNALKKVCPL